MRSGQLLGRAGREFAKNLIWMVAAFGVLAAVSVAATDLPLGGVMAFVGTAEVVMAAIMTAVVLGSNAHLETTLGGHHPGVPSLRQGDWPEDGFWDGGGGADGGG